MVAGKLAVAGEDHHFVGLTLPGAVSQNPIDAKGAFPGSIELVERVEIVVAPCARRVPGVGEEVSFEEQVVGLFLASRSGFNAARCSR